jgi:hypothetical protein
VFGIPDGISLDVAAPLLCAGDHALLTADALECRPRQAGRRRRSRLSRAHGREDRATPSTPKSPCCRRPWPKRDDDCVSAPTTLTQRGRAHP